MCGVVFLMLLMYKKLYGIHSYIMNEVRFCPVVSGVLSSLVLSCGVLSVWGFVLWGFVSVGFCPVGFCPYTVKPIRKNKIPSIFGDSGSCTDFGHAPDSTFCLVI